MIFGRTTKGRDARRDVIESGLFDEAHYRAQRPDLAGTAALDHFLADGWRQGFDPSPDFSTLYYLSAHPDVDGAGANPLVHYVHHGRREQRPTRPDDVQPSPEGEVRPPTAPSLAEWRSLLADAPPSREPVVDVVVPVYRGYSETLRCLYSVCAAPQRTPFRLSVIYDCGPDDVLRRALVRLAELGLFDFVETPSNGGFVRTTNIGLARRPGCDVVLLNSDTEVHGDWLDRLRAAAYGAERIASVTPFSNNAEICSYPHFCADNRAALEIDDAELDRMAAEVNRGQIVDIPTGVGFCMYVRRAMLDEIGHLSEEKFGRGYGEENDLCRRAAAAGWRNVLAGDVFVRHYGARSFGGEKAALVALAIEKVEYLHPGYTAQIHRFVARDPVRPLRRALDHARLHRRLAGRRAALFVTHRRGGGTERHVQELAAKLEEAGMPVLLCRPSGSDTGRFAIGDTVASRLPNLPETEMRDGPAAFAATLRGLNVAHVHIHHLVDFGVSGGDFFRKAALLAGCAYDVTLHDYFFVCPRITMIDRSGQYCGEPDIAACERCAKRPDAPIYGRDGVWMWREQTERLLGRARTVFVPSADTARRYGRYLPEQPFTVRPHFGEDAVPPRPAPSPRGDDVRTLAVIGAIGPHKGSELLHACAERAARDRPHLRFHVVGYTDRDDALRELGNVTVSGSYREGDLRPALAGLGASAAWFPAVWPETFSYTLSEALAVGLLPVAFDFGAIAERIREAGWGVLLPPSLMLRPDALVERLSAIDLVPPPGRVSTGASYPDIARDYYGWDQPPGLERRTG